MARIVDIKKGTQLSAALAYFAQQLPAKEVGWLELYGQVSDVSVRRDNSRLPSTYELVHCVCMISTSEHTISAVLADTLGHAFYSGDIQDLTSQGITGRLSTLPKTPWVPNLSKATESPRIDPKATQEQKAADITWADLAGSQPAPTKPAPPTNTQRQTSVELKTGDVLLHPRFGRCRVVRAPAFGKLKVRRPNGSFTDLHMKVIDIIRVETADGERLVHMQIKGAQSEG